MTEETNVPAEHSDEIIDNQKVETVQDPEAVLRKNRELLKQNAELKRLAEIARSFDFDKARAAIEAAERAEEEKLQKRGEYEKLIEQKAKAYEQRIAQEKSEREKIESTLLHEKLALSLIEKGVLPDRVSYLVKEMADQVELGTNDTGFVLKKRGGIGDAAEFNTLVEDVRAKSPFFFAAKIAAGTGGSGAQQNGGASARKWADLNRSEKAAAIREANGSVEAAQKKYS